MSIRKEISNRIRHFGRRAEFDEELHQEVQSHIEARATELEQSGLPRSAALKQARREFGPVAQAQEDSRAAWRFSWLEDLLGDMKYGVRLMGRSPGVVALVVVSLALGIGANTAIFSAVDALMLKNLPVQDPQKLVTFSYPIHGMPNGTLYLDEFAYPEFEKVRNGLTILSSVSAEHDLDRSNVTIHGPGGGLDDGQVSVSLVSGNYFETLGTRAQAGRTFTQEDDRIPGGHPVAVISQEYWKRRLGNSQDAIGRTFTLNSTTYTILGVTVPEFSGDWVGKPTDIWIPIAMQSEVMVDRPGLLTNPGPPWVRIIGRLDKGRTIPEAQAGINVLLAPKLGPNPPPGTGIKADSFAKGYSPQRDYFGKAFWILVTVVGFVLLIACANVANLLLARTAARRTEIAVRLALGARRGRIIRQLLTESILLAILGGAAGLLFSFWGTNALLSYLNSGTQSLGGLTFKIDAHPNARLLIFSTALCLMTALLFGLAPAFRASKISSTSILNGLKTSSGSVAGHLRIGKAIVVFQVALSLVILISAGLFGRTLHNLRAQNMGFERDQVLLVWTAPNQIGRVGAPLGNFIPTVEERVAALPGVASVGSSELGLLGGSGGSPVNVQGHVYAPNEEKFVAWNLVGPKYFETVGMKLLSGRDFNAGDTENSHRVAIINETMAHYFYGNENPIGRHFGMRRDTDFPVEIVGVVSDAKYDFLREVSQKMIFIPYRQDLRHMDTLCLAIRTKGDPAALKSQIRGVLADLDRTLPVLGVETMNEWVDETLLQERMIAMLSEFFSGLTLLLACVGLYGVISHVVARRTNEIGVRMALGASRVKILGMVFKGSIGLVLSGLVIGIPAALAATRLISSELFGVSAADPATIVMAAVLMLAVSAAASHIPALRASRVDPMVALRYE